MVIGIWPYIKNVRASSSVIPLKIKTMLKKTLYIIGAILLSYLWMAIFYSFINYLVF
jgi:hypothetical protein